MAVVTITYSAKQTLTITLASLATSSTWVAGQESTEVSNATDKYVDVIVEGVITVGTTPTTATQIQVWVWGSGHTAASTTARDVIDGLDSAETISSAGVRNSFMRLGGVGDVDSATSNCGYPFGPFSVANLFGGIMPKHWGVFVAHNTVAALHATAGNHEISWTGIKNDIT